MKTNILRFTMMLLLLCMAENSFSTPLLNENGSIDDDGYITNSITSGGVGYSIVDRSRTDGKDKEEYDEYDVLQGYTSATTPIEYTGMYLGTITSDNDSDDDLKNLISYFLDLEGDESFLFNKIDANNTSKDYFEVTYDSFDDDGEAHSGTWLTTNTPQSLVNFYSIKGATEYALYYVDPALASGVWSTVHLLNKGGQQPAISHIQVSLTDTAPIPEPATMILFGTGLAGLAGIMRKKRNG